MELKLYSVRPEAGTRDAAEERCYDALDALGISYLRADHEALYTMEALEPVEKALDCSVAKNLFLTNRQQTEFYLLIMPGNKPFKTKYLSAQLGCSRLSFGSEEHLAAYLGVTPGSASILGLLHDKEHKVRLIMDTDLRGETWFACHPCRNTSTQKQRFEDVLTKFLPSVNYELTWVELPAEME